MNPVRTPKVKGMCFEKDEDILREVIVLGERRRKF
jgi:hypothetical protein